MAVHLVLLTDVRTGGWITYTAHLALGLRHHMPVQLWRIGKRTEQRHRPYMGGLTYRNTTVTELCDIARGGEPMLVTASAPKAAADLRRLRRAGAAVTIHDPTELKPPVRAAVARGTGPVLTIRPVVQQRHVPHSMLHPHPYQRCHPQRAAAPGHAVAYSRVDWDKGTHHIAAANAQLAPGYRCQIYGSENRLYTHSFAEQYPAWREEYHGPWPATELWAGAALAARHRLVVDMSSIKGDGGATQYTHLEALDAGARLVLSRTWLTGDPACDTMAPYAVFVEPPRLDQYLAAPTAAPEYDGAALLARHDAAAVAAAVLNRITGT